MSPPFKFKVKSQKSKVTVYSLKYYLPFNIRTLEPIILDISKSSFNNELILSLSLLPVSLKRASQNFDSLADFKEWVKKFRKSLFELPVIAST